MRRYNIDKTVILLSLLIIKGLIVQGQTCVRKTITLNDHWACYPAYNVIQNIKKDSVMLPHTWNANDVFNGTKYNRETMIYQKKIRFEDSLKNSRLFLYFEGANSVANVFVNGEHVGEHYGGYTAFCLEITDKVHFGAENSIEVYVSNAYRIDVIPLSGDFNIYGGLHRPVHLLITGVNCISPLDYASSGVYIKQKKVSEKLAELDITTLLSIKKKSDNLKVKTTIYDRNSNIVSTKENKIDDVNITSISQAFSIVNPVLWNGKKNAYLYTIKTELLDSEVVVDKVTEKTGFRYFSVDYEKGFFLNGEYLDLYGFCKHIDRKGKGSALDSLDFKEEMDIIKESGANSLRLVHYPHSKPIYDQCDESGIVLWTEIPFVGPGGYSGASYVKNENLQKNARNMLIEMIRQNYNHPSVCFWGIFNELKMDYDNPVPFVKELNQIAKKEDPSRLTTLATFIDQNYFIGTTDLIAWNKYYGWYGGTFEQIGAFADEAHKTSQGTPVGISEYGAGGSINQHEWPAVKPVPTGSFHPEEWQAMYHEGNWAELSKRPFLWGKYIWVFADFGSSIRNEGDMRGINDKGVVTYDWKTKKDAFYFYKANWNPDPMIYITSRRFTERTNPVTDIKIYTNANETELYINGKKIGKKRKDNFNRVIWNSITLNNGGNNIVVKAKIGIKEISDSCEWNLNCKN